MGQSSIFVCNLSTFLCVSIQPLNSLCEMYRIGEHINTDGIWGIVWNWRDRMESVNGYKVSFQVDENILILGYGDFCKTVNTLKMTSLYTMFEYTFVTLGSPCSSVGKESAQCRRPRFDSWVRKLPWRMKWQPTPGFLPRESHRQRSLADYSLWGCKSCTQHSD